MSNIATESCKKSVWGHRIYKVGLSLFLFCREYHRDLLDICRIRCKCWINAERFFESPKSEIFDICPLCGVSRSACWSFTPCKQYHRRWWYFMTIRKYLIPVMFWKYRKDLWEFVGLFGGVLELAFSFEFEFAVFLVSGTIVYSTTAQ